MIEQIPSSVYFGLINFGLLVGLLVAVLRRPVREFFATRAVTMRQSVEGAQVALAAAEQQAKECVERLNRIESEIGALRKQFQEEGVFERATIIQRAKEYSEKLSKDTERMVLQELKRTKEQLRGTTVDLAILMAERYLREQISADDQMRLIKQYVNRLEQMQ